MKLLQLRIECFRLMGAFASSPFVFLLFLGIVFFFFFLIGCHSRDYRVSPFLRLPVFKSRTKISILYEIQEATC